MAHVQAEAQHPAFWARIHADRRREALLGLAQEIAAVAELPGHKNIILVFRGRLRRWARILNEAGDV